MLFLRSTIFSFIWRVTYSILYGYVYSVYVTGGDNVFQITDFEHDWCVGRSTTM